VLALGTPNGPRRARHGAGTAVAAAALLVPSLAAAQTPDLALHGPPAPLPATLAMRADDAPPPQPAPRRSLPVRVGAAFAETFLDIPKQFLKLEEKVVFHLDVGFGLAGGEPAGADARLANGALLADVPDYEPLRMYTFGDAVVGTRGLLLPSLTTYFASQFRIDHAGHPETGPLPTAYDGSSNGSALLTRSGYAELHGISDQRWLRPLFVRAGRQFRYGAAIAHFDGITAGYDTDAVELGAFSGQRVSLYGLHDDPSLDEDSRLITGSNARVNLYHVRKIPLVFGAKFLTFDGTRHFEGELGVRLSRDAVFRGTVRSRDSALAQEHASVRARLSEVTTVHVALDNRHTRDWSYDLVSAAPASDADDPRRYLALGPPVPRVQVSVRAGTVLFDNLDLLLRGAFARERAEGAPATPFGPSYLEAGAAAEVRFRRSLRVGGGFLARRYDREDYAGDDTAEALLAGTFALGERSFYQADASLQYNPGARRLDARAVFYASFYDGVRRFALDGIDPFRFEVRSGARFSVSGWATPRLRILGEYETAFAPQYLSPEIRGPKSLRMIAEAVF
jgi:hypothetical protein